MNRIATLLTILSLILGATSVATAQKKDTKSKEDKSKEMKTQLLRHVVLFKFKDSSSPEDVKQVEDAFRALPKKLKLIKSFEWGKNNSPENLNQGLTHCFFVTFKSEKDRDVYLTHPDHQAFVEVLKPHLDKVTVVDYWAAD
jgi:hypothetical protein